MNAAGVLAVAVVMGLPAFAPGQEKPGATPRGIDKAVADAWRKRDFEAGWMRELDGRVVLTAGYPKEGGALPAIWYTGPGRDLTDDGLKDLPAVDVPFALVLSGQVSLTDVGLEHVARQANLVWLDVRLAAFTREGLKPLAGLKALTTLKLDHGRVITESDAKHLAACKQLRRLSLSCCTTFGDEGLKELAGLTNLTSLDLDHTRVTDDGLKHLAGLTGLTTLGVLMTDVDGENLTPLAGLKKLTLFHIENIKLTDQLLRNLGELRMLHTLFQAQAYDENHGYREGDRRPTRPEEVRTFTLIGRAGTGEGVKHLACFPNLEYLHLGTEQATPDGLKYAAGLKSLTSLGIQSGANMRDGLKHLTDLKKLTTLRIGQGEVSPQDVKRVLEIKTLGRFDLPVTDQAMRVLHEAGKLHLLWGAATANGKRATADDDIVSFNLSNYPLLRGEGLKHVAKLKNLARINLRNTPVTREWLDDFARTRPKCEIVK